MLKSPSFLRLVLTLRECADLVMGLPVLSLGSPAGGGCSQNLDLGYLAPFVLSENFRTTGKVPPNLLLHLKN